ncbi:uncharacterized protein BDR25DRAFT_357108 [Lindgomyces ingoldianus]|uniref:Uncharacterized protein n=1 Tax=Lindgomyces ingoldianus TaxID=673940 RepID=A0ACB6QNY7_9PLEO|nr:uncharacterized protein BDR25DRAFT_357108 [Lindgomyces ingoldianus]KAF2468739.1 hypothetical protein BDR25DRAFT_357108 [Lindgomyces ingoldianus]
MEVIKVIESPEIESMVRGSKGLQLISNMLIEECSLVVGMSYERSGVLWIEDPRSYMIYIVDSAAHRRALWLTRNYFDSEDLAVGDLQARPVCSPVRIATRSRIICEAFGGTRGMSNWIAKEVYIYAKEWVRKQVTKQQVKPSSEISVTANKFQAYIPYEQDERHETQIHGTIRYRQNSWRANCKKLVCFDTLGGWKMSRSHLDHIQSPDMPKYLDRASYIQDRYGAYQCERFVHYSPVLSLFWIVLHFMVNKTNQFGFFLILRYFIRYLVNHIHPLGEPGMTNPIHALEIRLTNPYSCRHWPTIYGGGRGGNSLSMQQQFRILSTARSHKHFPIAFEFYLESPLQYQTSEKLELMKEGRFRNVTFPITNAYREKTILILDDVSPNWLQTVKQWFKLVYRLSAISQAGRCDETNLEIAFISLPCRIGLRTRKALSRLLRNQLPDDDFLTSFVVLKHRAPDRDPMPTPDLTDKKIPSHKGSLVVLTGLDHHRAIVSTESGIVTMPTSDTNWAGSTSSCGWTSEISVTANTTSTPGCLNEHSKYNMIATLLDYFAAEPGATKMFLDIHLPYLGNLFSEVQIKQETPPPETILEVLKWRIAFTASLKLNKRLNSLTRAMIDY